MWKHRIAATLLSGALLAAAVWAQRMGLPTGPMQEKARVACLGCHDARIILQQQLTGTGWTKNVDKMIRWGAPVAPEDRDALIDYFAQSFPPTPAEGGELVEAAGVEQARAACLSCHGADVITAKRLDRRGWTQVLEREIRWGASVRPEHREILLDYLVQHYGPGGTGFASGSVEVLTPLGGVDFTNYLARMLATVRRNWYSRIPEAARAGQQGTVVVEFSILRDGTVPLDELQIVSSSGNEAMDQAATNAIRTSTPFDPLPSAFKGPMVRLRFNFLYNRKIGER